MITAIFLLFAATEQEKSDEKMEECLSPLQVLSILKIYFYNLSRTCPERELETTKMQDAHS